ncbi:MAG: uracil-DNA glycosylase [candidate division Zixibacteria bacterium]|nr:uracil-DNA glycosylase [candidate division Zixibacteria bacterium]
MYQKPDNLHELLRRALMTQVELGWDEMVVDRSAVAAAQQEMSRVVSVDQVVAGGGNVQLQQGAANLFVNATYESLEDHRQAICNCELCPLGKTRNKFVYGVGNSNADIMFVGEAPGADEDRLGEPFVGRAGQLLDKILEAMKLTRQDIYIANILKCRPPGNRDPQPEEMALCFPYLKEQVRLIKPKIICGLGRISTQAMLNTTTPLGKLRKQWHTYEGVPFIATYHPAALLRFQQYKKDTWEDMKMLLARYETLK